MEHPIYLTARVLQIVFLIGVGGCLISIPIIAAKFASVLFEKDKEEQPESPNAAPENEGDDDETAYSELQ